MQSRYAIARRTSYTYGSHGCNKQTHGHAAATDCLRSINKIYSIHLAMYACSKDWHSKIDSVARICGELDFDLNELTVSHHSTVELNVPHNMNEGACTNECICKISDAKHTLNHGFFYIAIGKMYRTVHKTWSYQSTIFIALYKRKMWFHFTHTLLLIHSSVEFIHCDSLNFYHQLNTNRMHYNGEENHERSFVNTRIILPHYRSQIETHRTLRTDLKWWRDGKKTYTIQ